MNCTVAKKLLYRKRNKQNEKAVQENEIFKKNNSE